MKQSRDAAAEHPESVNHCVKKEAPPERKIEKDLSAYIRCAVWQQKKKEKKRVECRLPLPKKLTNCGPYPQPQSLQSPLITFTVSFFASHVNGFLFVGSPQAPNTLAV